MIFELLDFTEPWSSHHNSGGSNGITWSKVVLFPLLLVLVIVAFFGYIFISVMQEV